MGESDTENRQYLTFRLNDETFAFDIKRVREVLDIINITKVPRTPEFMLGVINLRGNVVPVVDLHLALGMAPSERTVETCIIIVECQMDAEHLLVGALADSLHAVVDISAENISAAPNMGVSFNPAFIQHIGKMGEDYMIVLSMDRVLAANEIKEAGPTTSLAPQSVQGNATMDSNSQESPA